MAVRPERSSIIVQTFLLQFFSRQSFQVCHREQMNLAIGAAKGSKCSFFKSVNAHYLQGLARGVYILLIRPITARQMSGIETVVSVLTLWSIGSDF